MTHIIVPENRRLTFYLAAEEYLATTGEDCLMLWQTRPTVIFGRHQDMAAEVNLPWCQQHGVEVYRRKSGGGCVYSDEGNQMISYIHAIQTPLQGANAADGVFSSYLKQLANILSEAGAAATTTSHNDVLVDGHKVSGNACHITPQAIIVHGTLLWHSNIDNLTSAITPSAEKLRKHAVQSVRQRVINLSDLLPCSLPDLRLLLRARLSSCTRALTDAEIKEVERLEAPYLDPQFISSGK